MSCSFYFLKNQYFGSMKPVLHKNAYIRPTMYCFAESTLFFVLKCFEKVRNLFIDIPLYCTPYTLGKWERAYCAVFQVLYVLFN